MSTVEQKKKICSMEQIFFFDGTDLNSVSTSEEQIFFSFLGDLGDTSLNFGDF